jgi:hypothetical protein|nr:MAG TPA: YspA [Caudoviricetes sp.]
MARSWLVSCGLLGRTRGGLVGSVLFYDFPRSSNTLKDQAKMKIIKEKVVAFVGNGDLITPDNVPDRNLENVIRTELLYVIEELYNEGKTVFLSGLNSDFGMLVAEVVLKYAQSHPGAQLYAVISSEKQQTDYSYKDQLRYKRILEKATGCVTLDEFAHRTDFQASEIVVYGNCEEPIMKHLLKRAEKEGVEIWNMYDGIEDYFSIQSPVKQFLQEYPDVPSFKYGREGLIFRGNNQPFPVPFSDITHVERKNNRLCFTLRDGMVIMASLLSDDCYVRLPPSDFDVKFFC